MTITGVEVSPDLRNARVHVSCYGDEQAQQESIRALRHAAGFLRRALNERVRLRTRIVIREIPCVACDEQHGMHLRCRPDHGIRQFDPMVLAKANGAFRDVSHSHRARGRLQAYGIGVVHGVGGTAGVGLLLLATIPSHALAVVALVVFAICTALSMALLSTGWSVALGSAPVRRCFHHVAPALGVVSLAFGVWYALGAQGLLPYML